jgi:hypothetical protein
MNFREPDVETVSQFWKRRESHLCVARIVVVPTFLAVSHVLFLPVVLRTDAFFTGTRG